MDVESLNDFATRLGGYNVIVPSQTFRTLARASHMLIPKKHTMCMNEAFSLNTTADPSQSSYCALTDKPLRLNDKFEYLLSGDSSRLENEDGSTMDYTTQLSRFISSSSSVPFEFFENALLI